MTKARKPLHQRINWPDSVNLYQVTLGIMKCFIGHFDAACFPIDPTYKYFKAHRFYTSNDSNERRAAMWYAVMRTAIETYGLKA